MELIESDKLKIVRVEMLQQIEQTRELFTEYIEALIAETPAFTNYLRMENFADELDNLPLGYVPPEGLILLALFNAEVAGCVAFRKFGGDVCEMKRLFVKPKFRALKLGKQLTTAIIEAARQAGYKRMRLETSPAMMRAQSLYFKLGFQPIESYNDDNPIDGTLFLELVLAD